MMQAVSVLSRNVITKKETVILSERGPKRFSVPKPPRTGLRLRGGVWGWRVEGSAFVLQRASNSPHQHPVSQPQPSPASTKPIARLGSLSHVRRALRHRNFKLFFAGQGISVIGAWIARGATTRLVYHLPHSALLLGIAGFGLMQCAAASSTIIQSLVTEDMRDRAMGYCTTAFFGAAPFGSPCRRALTALERPSPSSSAARLAW
jgi:hypothetical protein